MTFDEALKRLIGMHGLSGQDAADLLGVTPATMSAWITGKSRPGFTSMHAICVLFHVGFFSELTIGPFENLINPERYRIAEENIAAARKEAFNA